MAKSVKKKAFHCCGLSVTSQMSVVTDPFHLLRKTLNVLVPFFFFFFFFFF